MWRACWYVFWMVNGIGMLGGGMQGKCMAVDAEADGIPRACDEF